MDGIGLTVNSSVWRLLLLLVHACPHVTSTCGGTWSLLRGDMMSPGYPSTYTSGSTCIYNITTPSTEQKIQMRFNKLDTGLYDTFQVENSSRQTIFRRGGKTGYGTVPPAASYFVTFIRKTGSYFYGFQATWAECGGDWTSDSGNFSSPYYPYSYYKLAHCSYTITPSSGNQIILTIEKLNLAVGHFLQVKDGMGRSLANLTGIMAFYHFGPSSSFNAEFKTFCCQQSTGFHATWQAVQPEKATPPAFGQTILGMSAFSNMPACVTRKFTKVSTDGLGLSCTIREKMATLDCMSACKAEPSCSYFTNWRGSCALLRHDNASSQPLPPTLFNIKDFTG
ncbi:deleted in malignant brain tumors 1 protein-like [Haliotis rufescens]|uniref:deleted in malignant brain tumors 1 protein-like n=1 Tax=Haliotis rufescens TaxID=6454 RepID=UPI00201ED4B2|nr:deleted in malignant brain tumors 1 protein-like [Haliotis rufescens]